LLCEPSLLAVLPDEPSRALCHRAGAQRSLRVERIDCALDDKPQRVRLSVKRGTAPAAATIFARDLLQVRVCCFAATLHEISIWVH
jgi:hypothetical protein